MLGADVTGLGFSLATAPSYAGELPHRLVHEHRRLTWSGNQTVADGETIYVLATDGEYGADYRARIDGLTIEAATTSTSPHQRQRRRSDPARWRRRPVGQPVSQGDGIFVNGYARHLQITNNMIRSNSGGYSGAIRYRRARR